MTFQLLQTLTALLLLMPRGWEQPKPMLRLQHRVTLPLVAQGQVQVQRSTTRRQC